MTPNESPIVIKRKRYCADFDFSGVKYRALTNDSVMVIMVKDAYFLSSSRWNHKNEKKNLKKQSHIGDGLKK